MHGFEAYHVNEIETASGLKLVVMLYDGAIRFSKKASGAIAAKDFETAHINIIKVQNIVSELLSSLNFEAGEISDTLSGLYLYMHRRLVEANLQKDASILEEVVELLENLKAGWDELLKNEPAQNKTTQHINISG
ncbi:MAG: flagellar export chaperone FliS [Brevinema sp.]